MRLLLDTHVAIWGLVEPTQINPAVCELIGDMGNDVFVSVVSIWEIAIKFALRKKTSPPFSAQQALREFAEAGYQMLEISARHAAATERLPLLHRDPFDRLLIAQALEEPLRLVTRDQKLFPYSDTIIQA